jgi:hypothetical protein
MSTYPPPGPGVGGVGQRIEEAIELIEMEVRHAAAYINAAVIPQVRKESISALRNVANSLRNFADRLDAQQDAQQARQQPQPSNPPKDPRP